MIRRFVFYQISRLFNFFWRQLFRWINFRQLAHLLSNFVLVFIFSLITPAVLRPIFATNFTELRQPLEFTFRTCLVELAGVCSFPEAEFWVEEAGMRLHPYYYYSFVLDLILYDTQQNRALSLMIGNIQLRDGQNKLLANFHKSVPVFKAFPGRSIFSYFYTLTRNTIFWPLWIIGYFSTNSDVSDQLTVHFPNYYMEKPDDQATKQIIVQLQNKFIQLSSATLRIRTHIGLWSYFLSEYPISSYFVLVAVCFVFFFSIFILYYCVNFLKRFFNLY